MDSYFPFSHYLKTITGDDDGGALRNADAQQIRILLNDRNKVVPAVSRIDVLINGRTAERNSEAIMAGNSLLFMGYPGCGMSA